MLKKAITLTNGEFYNSLSEYFDFYSNDPYPTLISSKKYTNLISDQLLSKVDVIITYEDHSFYEQFMENEKVKPYLKNYKDFKECENLKDSILKEKDTNNENIIYLKLEERILFHNLYEFMQTIDSNYNIYTTIGY